MGTDHEVDVRDARPEDEQAVFALAEDLALSFTVDREDFRRSFATLVHAEDAHVLVATVDGVVAGYLLGSVHGSFFANGPVAWVEEVAVHEHRRRRGLGARLLTEFERRAAARGARLVALATTRADRFYAALGYEERARYFRKNL